MPPASPAMAAVAMIEPALRGVLPALSRQARKDSSNYGAVIPSSLFLLYNGHIAIKGLSAMKIKQLYGIFVLSLLSACGGDAIDPDQPPVTIGDWYRPAPSVTWQWQLVVPDGATAINTSYNVDIYDVDLFDTSSDTIAALKNAGRKVICYFSAGSYENWRTDAEDFNSDDLGNTLDEWADEQWLDIRSDSVQQIMLSRLELAVTKGCDGVEPDNVDGYTNDSGFPLTFDDQLYYNRFIANEAHNNGLSVALKNDLDQIDELVQYFDFSVNEQCHEYAECDSLSSFVNARKAVLNAEYDMNLWDSICEESINNQFSTLFLPLDLDDSFRERCL